MSSGSPSATASVETRACRLLAHAWKSSAHTHTHTHTHRKQRHHRHCEHSTTRRRRIASPTPTPLTCERGSLAQLLLAVGLQRCDLALQRSDLAVQAREHLHHAAHQCMQRSRGVLWLRVCCAADVSRQCAHELQYLWWQ
jgi:hypothetical protein